MGLSKMQARRGAIPGLSGEERGPKQGAPIPPPLESKGLPGPFPVRKKTGHQPWIDKLLTTTLFVTILVTNRRKERCTHRYQHPVRYRHSYPDTPCPGGQGSI